MEVDVPGLELKLGFAGGDALSLLVFGNEPKVRLPDKAGVGSIGAGRRVDPAAARYEPTVLGSYTTTISERLLMLSTMVMPPTMSFTVSTTA